MNRTQPPKAQKSEKPSAADDDYLTPKELSAVLKIPEKTLAAWRTQRKGPIFYRIGVHVRYPRLKLDAWFLELECEAKSWMAS